jgi:hypothetical protein
LPPHRGVDVRPLIGLSLPATGEVAIGQRRIRRQHAKVDTSNNPSVGALI